MRAAGCRHVGGLRPGRCGLEGGLHVPGLSRPRRLHDGRRRTRLREARDHVRHPPHRDRQERRTRERRRPAKLCNGRPRTARRRHGGGPAALVYSPRRNARIRRPAPRSFRGDDGVQYESAQDRDEGQRAAGVQAGPRPGSRLGTRIRDGPAVRRGRDGRPLRALEAGRRPYPGRPRASHAPRPVRRHGRRRAS